MPDISLITILGRVYGAKILHRGSMDAIITDFIAACADPGFRVAADAKLAALVALEKKVGARQMRERDVIGAVHLDFLREQIAAL